ncbi:MAG: ABC transporter ATP-binding protein [Alysiella sp.]|uniref:ABC transporter ATP-binding protein n=1 Tax=Alysiella sp. TaxID=1872483 RepID=UPI0026DD7A5C|nr:ABC transporter ATP-binding protein [Alysiella sp.]MDO4433648.1 ABC transporter ATP-binding protein [Alysiella sp.]
MTFALRVQNAQKTYAGGFVALKGIDFDVAQGEFFALLGPNGAGKTTLISAISGLNCLTGGKIEVMGYDVEKDPYHARLNLGLVPQELVFDPFFSVREVLRIQSGYFGIRHNDDWIDEMLHHLGLSDKADSNMRHLSGGMKRRVMVAQALVHRPPLLILDEPTAGVDVELRHSLWTFMQSLNQQGHTIILTTHYLEEAEQYCHRIAVMKQGKLVALDKTENLLHNDKGIRLAVHLSNRLPENLMHLCVQTLAEHHYVLLLDNPDALFTLSGSLKNASVQILDMKTLDKDLEQVFVGLTTGEAA